jgi:curved DNA-binding protein CbpA
MPLDDFDPYAVLGVRRDVEPDVIKAAYRALARIYHPDVASSDAARRRMVEINRAWEILGDPTQRAALDAASESTRHAGNGHSANSTPDPAWQPAWMARHAASRRPVGGWGGGAAGPPPGRASGSVIDFGIYRGWSLGEIERRDPGYLDWLVDRVEGEPYRAEIRAVRARRYGPQPARRARFGFG